MNLCQFLGPQYSPVEGVSDTLSWHTRYLNVTVLYPNPSEPRPPVTKLWFDKDLSYTSHPSNKNGDSGIWMRWTIIRTYVYNQPTFLMGIRVMFIVHITDTPPYYVILLDCILFCFTFERISQTLISKVFVQIKISSCLPSSFKE